MIDSMLLKHLNKMTSENVSAPLNLPKIETFTAFSSAILYTHTHSVGVLEVDTLLANDE